LLKNPWPGKPPFDGLAVAAAEVWFAVAGGVLEVVVATGGGTFFGTFAIFGCTFFGIVVAVVEPWMVSITTGVEVEIVSGVDVATGGVVDATICVLVKAVDVAAPKTLPPVAATPEPEGLVNGCNRVSQLLPDAATTA